MTRSPSSSILLFGQISKVREWKPLLRELLAALKETGIHFAVLVFTAQTQITASRGFATLQYSRESEAKTSICSSDLQQRLDGFAAVGREYFPEAKVHTDANVNRAVEAVISFSQREKASRVFVTGSQHLVGGVLKCITPAA